jgi:predicted nucleotidyltransferase
VRESCRDLETNPVAASPALAARSIAQTLATHPDVRGVGIFGSVARGDAGDESDIDLVVLGAHPEITRRSLMRLLPEDLRARHLTMLCYTDESLGRLMESGTSFSEHLRLESTVLFDQDGALRKLLRLRPTSRIPVRVELDAELAQLDVYRDLSLFRGNFLFVLAKLYSIGKAIVILTLSADSKPTFSREIAFDLFQQTHPRVAGASKTIRVLRPFHRLVTRHVEEPLPFPYRGCEDKVTEAIAAIHEIAEVTGNGG